MYMTRDRLPQNAKGIRMDGFSVIFGKGKIMLLPVGGADHYTLQLETGSKIIDLHETVVETNQHTTLFAIPSDRLPAVFKDCAGMIEEFLRLFRPLRFEWLKPRGIRVVRGLRPVSEDDVTAVTRKQRGWLVIDEEQLKKNLVVASDPAAMRAFPDGAFSLVKRGREIGVGLKQTDGAGNLILCWLEHGDVERFSARWESRIVGALTRSAIPPEQFGGLPFTSPRD